MVTCGSLSVSLPVFNWLLAFLDDLLHSSGITPLDYYDEEKLKRRRIACQNKAVDHLAKLSEGFANSIEVHVRVSYGEVLEAIVEAARFHKADMVITGRRKHEKLLKRLFSPGSVSSALLTNTDLSVLVIR
ncbi:hypothetical protein T439DRAFT_327774 [Meredithblackwellia eburnea MCA 4105]